MHYLLQKSQHLLLLLNELYINSNRVSPKTREKKKKNKNAKRKRGFSESKHKHRLTRIKQSTNYN